MRKCNNIEKQEHFYESQTIYQSTVSEYFYSVCAPEPYTLSCMSLFSSYEFFVQSLTKSNGIDSELKRVEHG